MGQQSLRIRRAEERRVVYPAKVATAPRFLILVPVFRELANGNLARFLASVAEAGSDPSDVDLFFLVNNSPEEAAQAGEGFAENQRTLEFLKTASGPFAVHALDLSSDGFEKNMGKLRQAGLDTWESRYPAEELARTVVVHLDADVKLPEGFFPRLRAIYGSYPALEALFFGRDFELRGSPAAALLFTHPHYRVKKALFDFTNLRRGLPLGVATYQISARFAAHARAGGFPPLAKDEDSMFTVALIASAWWAYDSKIEMVSEDRTRAAGFNSARRARDLNARRVKGIGERLRRWRRVRRAYPFSKIEALRPPAPREFYLQFGLFEPLAKALNEEARRGRRTFTNAAEELRRRAEAFLGVPMPLAPTAFTKSEDPLPVEAVVPGTGGAVLPPVAHIISACLLLPTQTPATDLVGMIRPHLSAEGQARLSGALAAAEAAEQKRVGERTAALMAYLRGEPLAGSADPFLRWAAASPELFASARGAVNAGRLAPEAAVARLAKVFPDYLAGSHFAREAGYLKALIQLTAEAFSQGEPGRFEDALASLNPRPEF